MDANFAEVVLANAVEDETLRVYSGLYDRYCLSDNEESSEAAFSAAADALLSMIIFTPALDSLTVGQRELIEAAADALRDTASGAKFEERLIWRIVFDDYSIKEL